MRAEFGAPVSELTESELSHPGLVFQIGGPESEVDVLVEFEPGHIPGLSFFRMENELAEILGRKVDLNTPQSLSRYFRHSVLAEAEVQYSNP